MTGARYPAVLDGVQRGVITGFRWLGNRDNCEIFVNTEYERNWKLHNWSEADWDQVRDWDCVYIAVRKVETRQRRGKFYKEVTYGLGADVSTAIANARAQKVAIEFPSLYDAVYQIVIDRQNGKVRMLHSSYQDLIR